MIQEGNKKYPAELHAQIVEEVERFAREREENAKAVAEAIVAAKENAQAIISDLAAMVKAGVSRGIVAKKKNKEDEEPVRAKDEEEEDDEEDETTADRKKVKVEKGARVGKDEDTWGLTSAEVRKDWRAMKCPPFELFEWGRVVVDEFTYIKDEEHLVLVNLCANARWVLSGTTPIEKFYDVKGVASFLGIHLGVNEAPPTHSETKQMTSWEHMQYFRELYTNAWHARRYAPTTTPLSPPLIPSPLL